MLKVVLCIPSLQTAGAEKFVVDLATNLDCTKVKIYVAITRNNEIGIYGELLKKQNIEIVDLSGKNVFQMFMKQYRFFQKIRPDVIHTNIGSLFHVMVMSKILNIKGRLYTVHNEAKLLYGESKLRKKVYKLAFSFFGFEPVAICNSIKESFVEAFGSNYENMYTINNGVDIERFKPSDLSIDSQQIQFINTGTMYWIKNQKEIIEAFSVIAKKYSNVKLTILGDGQERNNLENLVKEKEILNKVYMPGICKNVEDYLKSADVYISSSLTEGLPLSMLEAMACGLPIITSNVGGCVDIVKTDLNGIVYRKQNTKELINAMDRIIKNTSYRKSLAKNSRSMAESWSEKKCAEKYLNLYKLLSR